MDLSFWGRSSIWVVRVMKTYRPQMNSHQIIFLAFSTPSNKLVSHNQCNIPFHLPSQTMKHADHILQPNANHYLGRINTLRGVSRSYLVITPQPPYVNLKHMHRPHVCNLYTHRSLCIMTKIQGIVHEKRTFTNAVHTCIQSWMNTVRSGQN